MRNAQIKISSARETKETVFIAVDTVGEAVVASRNQPIIVKKNIEFLMITGWAVDICAKGLFKEVYVCVDGCPYRVSASIKRPDVAKYFKSSKYKLCGFRAEIPIKEISFGWHLVSIAVVSRNGAKKQGLSPIWIFRQGKKRGLGGLFFYEIQQLLTRPAHFFQRAQAAFRHIFHKGLWSFLDGYLNRMYRVSDSVEKNTKIPSLPELNENFLISVDKVGRTIVASRESKPIIVSRNEVSLMVTGWVVDVYVKGLLDEVYVCLNGRPYLATYGINRQDVANHLNNSAYELCGFRVEIPTEEISFGWHKVSITVIGADSTKKEGLSPVWIFRQGKKRGLSQLVFYEMQQLLTRPAHFFQRARAASKHIFRFGLWSFCDDYLNRMYRVSDSVQKNEKTSIVDKKNATILISVDMVGKTIVRSRTQPIIVSMDEEFLLVTGWAVDERLKGLFEEFYVCLDGCRCSVTYGISRPDVAKHLNNQIYAASGFRAEIPLAGVISGRHRVSFTVVSRDGIKKQRLCPVWIFLQGKKRGLSQLVFFEIQQLLTSPIRFCQRARAASEHIFRFGLWSFWDDYLDRMYRVSDSIQKYRKWIVRNEPPHVWELQRLIQSKKGPLISIIVPVYETPQAMLTAMIQSVVDQTYHCWELCIADGGSQSGHILKILKSFEAQDPRIKVVYLSENQGISGNSNAAIAISSGDFVAFLDHDDLLAPNALFEIVKAINEYDDIDLLYSDEDNITSDGKLRLDPYFKPDFSPDTLRTGNYISHFLVIRKILGDELGWLRCGFDGAQDYDLVLRASERARRIVHVPRVLYHWRVHSMSTASGHDVKPYAQQAGRRALFEHLERTVLSGEIEDGEDRFLYKVNFALNVQPLVSIIIPNKDQADVLERCVRSVLDKGTYKNFEIIIVDNNSQQNKTFILYKELCRDLRVRIVSWNRPFNFSALNNFAVLSVRGEVLLFLNNDTEVISADWLERMLQYAMRPDVGVVGAKLYYPDGKLQHAGVIVGLGGVAGHVLKHNAGDQAGEFSRLKRVQNYSAVTAACLMMRRRVYDEVGGFDEALAVAFNDVDLCLKVREKGYLVVWTPYAELYHHESKSRGYDDTAEKKIRLSNEVKIFKDRWSYFLAKGDPYYNPNLTLHAEDFSIKTV